MESLSLNHLQTQFEDLNLESQPKEVQEQFLDFFNNVPLIRSLVSPERKRAKDLERDNEGKIIVDITHPHILEDMQYFRPAARHYELTGRYTDLRPNPNPNSEFGKWIREETRRCWEGYVRESDGEWIPGDLYFFWNYTPMSISKRVEGKKKSQRVIGFPSIWEGHYLKAHYLEQARDNGKMAVELASRQKGKAHPYSQAVYTPEGKRLWGDIQVGDVLFGDNGKPTRVIDIPFNEVTDIYTVTLSDGRKLQCSLGHLFKVRDSRKKEQVRVLSLEEILNSDYYHLRKDGKHEAYYSIPVNGEVEFNERQITIDPYVLGLILGDGCLRTNYKSCVMFTSRDEDIDTYRQYSPYVIDKVKGKYSYRIRIPFVDRLLDEYKLNGTDSSTKFIPEDYIFNSKEVRLNVLKGILDTDGTVNNNGVPMLTTTSKRLADDVEFLCRSLGISTRRFTKQGKYYGKACKLTYNITILADSSVFNLERKKHKVTSYSTISSRCRKDWTHIVDISYSHKELAKCVTVDNESHCYQIGEFVVTHNSFYGAAMLAKRFILGESKDVTERVVSYITATDKSKLSNGDQTLDKFQYDIDFIAQHMQWPARRLFNSLSDFNWQMGYKDLDSGTNRGTLNSVVGKSSQKDTASLIGSRGVLYLFEEAGYFSNLLGLWNNLLPSVMDNDDVYGMLYGYGTSGDDESDFSALQEIMYNPEGYKAYGVDNVYDKEGLGKKLFTYFFPGYLNLAGCYDENGNSDVTKALLTILLDRYKVKYNSSDPATIAKKIAHIPITPQEAILRVKGSIFPTVDITERINQLDNDTRVYDDVYIGDLVFNSSGQVEFVPTDDVPIRDFPLKDNKAAGAIEIYSMPKKDSTGKVPAGRYIVGHDPVDDDESNTMSLTSTFVLDLFTDEIVCEWTGRLQYADDNFERLRKICLFYNAKCMYEQNKKGAFAYFSMMNSLYLLADTPEYLKDKMIIKEIGYGNRAKGINATQPVNKYADKLTQQWLLKRAVVTKEIDGNETEVEVPQLYKLKNRAFLKECLLYSPDVNVDRVRAFGMLMLYREEFMILYGGDVASGQEAPSDYLGKDKFFTVNYDDKKALYNNMPDYVKRAFNIQ